MEKKQLENITQYFSPYTHDCFSNALSSLLLCQKQDPGLVTADYLGFLYDRENGCIGLNYPFRHQTSFQFTREELNTSYPYLYFLEPGADADREAVRLSGHTNKIIVQLILTASPDDAHGQLKDSINRNVPVMIGIDLYYIPYHKYHKNRHTVHYVVVTGYDDEQEMYSLFDTHKTTGSNFRGSLPYAVIREARSSRNPQFNKELGAYERPLNNIRVEVRETIAASGQCSGQQNRAAGYALLDESLERLSGNRRILGIPCGLDSLQLFKKDFLDKCTTAMDADFAQQLAAYYIESFKTFSRNRKRFSVFLAEFLPAGYAEYGGRLQTALQNSAKYWDTAANLCFKLSLGRQQHTLAAVANHLELIIAEESTVKALLYAMRCTAGYTA